MPAFSLPLWFDRQSTGVKLLIALSLALLPLGGIALVASIDANRAATRDRSADLAIAAAEASRKLATGLVGDMAAMRYAANALAAGNDPRQVCAQLAATMTVRPGIAVPFSLFGAPSEPVCTGGTLGLMRPSTIGFDTGPSMVVNGDAIDIRVPARSGGAVVVARYDRVALARLARPALAPDSYALRLNTPRDTVLLTNGTSGVFARGATAPVGVFDAELALSAIDERPSTAALLLPWLPLLMWASAAAVTFLMVDRLLIRPLKRLRLAVAGHLPGVPFAPITGIGLAREIRDLGGAFSDYADRIARNEASLADALMAQTQATREVHHRVKNNIQIIASIVRLHARAAPSADAANAFAAIQRRVDAMAIVNRHHYAEVDARIGIDVKAMLAELATNLRSSFTPTAPAISITAESTRATQDVAIALGFLVTELVELSTVIDPQVPITIALSVTGEDGRVAVQSAALADSSILNERLADHYGRIIDGLARQLRTNLSRDPVMGRFAVSFSALPAAA